MDKLIKKYQITHENILYYYFREYFENNLDKCRRLDIINESYTFANLNPGLFNIIDGYYIVRNKALQMYEEIKPSDRKDKLKRFVREFSDEKIKKSNISVDECGSLVEPEETYDVIVNKEYEYDTLKLEIRRAGEMEKYSSSNEDQEYWIKPSNLIFKERSIPLTYALGDEFLMKSGNI